MGKFKKLTLLLLFILFFVTYSKAPTDSTVEQLIAAQYEEGNKIMQAAKANAGNDKMAQDISSLMERMMPTLERVEISIVTASRVTVLLAVPLISPKRLREIAELIKPYLTFIKSRENGRWIINGFNNLC